MKRFFLFVLLGTGILACRSGQEASLPQQKGNVAQDSFAQKRNMMVREQIEWRGITDTLVLNAMRKVPRHRFVPDYLVDQAYIDSPLPIGEEQTISQPYIVAFMTASLGLTGNEKVLEIGTGSGYQAAVLAEIVKEVYTIEIVPILGRRAEALFKTIGYSNIHITIGDGYRGWPGQAPFDGIIVTAAPDHIPQPLIDELKIGGRMVIPVGDLYQELILLTKQKDGSITRKSILPVRFVPMTGEAQQKRK